MSCCGYHTLQWYYTYPSNPYKYVEIRRPAPVRVEKKDAKKENYVPQSEKSVHSWWDLNMGWFNPPTARR